MMLKAAERSRRQRKETSFSGVIFGIGRLIRDVQGFGWEVFV